VASSGVNALVGPTHMGGAVAPSAPSSRGRSRTRAAIGAHRKVARAGVGWQRERLAA
jgi:hypothetical protein